MSDISRRLVAVTDTAFRVTMRQLAEAEDASDRRRLYDMLASQIEVALNNQANNTQVVLWDVQERAYEKIDALHEHQSDTNLLLAGVADGLAAIQASVQQVLAANKETARGQRKLATDMKKLTADMAASKEDRADLRARLSRIEAFLIPGMTPEEATARREEYEQMLPALRRMVEREAGS